MGATPILVSVVSPLFNEEGNVRHFVDRVLNAMRALDYAFEVILVDDGSSDGTWDRICEVANESREVIGVRLSRNFGHQGALLAGLHESRGRVVISMDGDLQHPPETLPKMLAAWQDGAQIVLTRRLDNERATSFKRLSSEYFYRIFSAIAETKIEPGSSDFRLMDRRALDELLKLRYGQPFVRGAVQTLGFRQVTIDHEVGDRFSGKSKYTLPKMLRFARNGLVSHSAIPLRVGIYLGLFTGLLSIAELTYVIVQALLGQTVPGWASTLGLIALLFSILFVILGIVGLYIEDIHRLLKNSPHYILAEVVGNVENSPGLGGPFPTPQSRSPSEEAIG